MILAGGTVHSQWLGAQQQRGELIGLTDSTMAVAGAWFWRHGVAMARPPIWSV
jgi:hypothetical protein